MDPVKQHLRALKVAGEETVSPAAALPDPAVRAGRRSPRGDRRRAAIIDAAMTLFARHGYRGASISAIADAVEITQSGLLHHFPTKEDLLIAVLLERDRRDNERTEQAFDRTGGGVFRSLESIVEQNADSRATAKLFTVLVGEASVSDEHPAHRHFAERYDALARVIASRLEAAKETGEIAPAAASELVARIVLALMDGLQIQWLLDSDFDMPEAFKAAAELMESALEADASSSGFTAW